MLTKLTLEQLNALSPSEFHDVFKNVVESWPEAAIFCSAVLPFKSIDSLCDTFDRYLDKLQDETKCRIMRQYPDLAGKLLDSHELTSDSSFEHSCAGLDRLSDERKQRLNDFNERYKAKFGFPFVICVREAGKFEIIFKAVTERINHDPDKELLTGIEEVKKICRLRILQLVQK
ncbi:2-oxo-4-hydroxy-4-carboxy-5-ureidoimidazoline decarboxylase-like [Uranotaenia lowii]|uniref:2-oxo-4-hydroxy-4-carboxy-5-ureidoimidazoline decarboxylase-like n=1 Tax=Uranotaenia lowii TaxID=190385 RepID=UPI00247AC51E|nr:2-oxo-4-hydroxy-4-carboxy-5-ureidoimidazoline decarboxylase-like [Uranotaenia lowii]